MRANNSCRSFSQSSGSWAAVRVTSSVRARLAPTYIVKRLAECGAWGVNLHDNDLVPFGADKATVSVPVPKKAVWFLAQIVYADPTAEILTHGTSGHSMPVGAPGADKKIKKMRARYPKAGDSRRAVKRKK